MESQAAHPTAEELKFIERFGMLFEQGGLAPMAGRILGWLLICDPPNQSMSDLTEVLRASKGSISTSLNTLTGVGWVEKLRLPGERRAYYRIPEGIWTHLLELRLKFFSIIRQLAEDGLRLIEHRPKSSKVRLTEMFEVFSFFEREIPALLQQWKARQK